MTATGSDEDADCVSHVAPIATMAFQKKTSFFPLHQSRQWWFRFFFCFFFYCGPQKSLWKFLSVSSTKATTLCTFLILLKCVHVVLVVVAALRLCWTPIGNFVGGGAQIRGSMDQMFNWSLNGVPTLMSLLLLLPRDDSL